MLIDDIIDGCREEHIIRADKMEIGQKGIIVDTKSHKSDVGRTLYATTNNSGSIVWTYEIGENLSNMGYPMNYTEIFAVKLWLD